MKRFISLAIIGFCFFISCKSEKKETGNQEQSELKNGILVGAIRWDAWVDGDITHQVELSLGPQKYHQRLPWYAEVITDSTVRIDGSSQQVMDQEISFAAEAGLDYWAFLLYPESETMSESLRQYLKSDSRKRINFCLILHNAFGVDEKQWPAERDRAVALLEEPGYQKVLNERPLVYAFMLSYKGTFPAERFADFLRVAHARKINPYCVYMGWDPSKDFEKYSALGFEAVSAYACGSADTTYTQLCQRVENRYWQNAVTGKTPYIPLLTTGWEKNPRKDHPVSWELGQSYHQQNVFPSIATPDEITAHLFRGLTFVKEHPEICAAKSVIIYAWNEFDEGGWLAPTWTPDGKGDNRRLEAVGRILTTKNTAR